MVGDQQGDSQHEMSEQQNQTHVSSFIRRSQYQMFVDLAGAEMAVARQITKRAKRDTLFLILITSVNSNYCWNALLGGCADGRVSGAVRLAMRGAHCQR